MKVTLNDQTQEQSKFKVINTNIALSHSCSAFYYASFAVKCFNKVGAAGFEPATSCSQSRRDNRTTLRPEHNVSP